jgi:hypothetical protein
VVPQDVTSFCGWINCPYIHLYFRNSTASGPQNCSYFLCQLPVVHLDLDKIDVTGSQSYDIPYPCKNQSVHLSVHKYCERLSKLWRLLICLRKLPFCVVRCGQKGHWNWGSFPHSCLRCWLSEGRCWYTLEQLGQLYGPLYRSLPECQRLTNLVSLGRGLENGAPTVAANPKTQIKRGTLSVLINKIQINVRNSKSKKSYIFKQKWWKIAYISSKYGRNISSII